MSLSKIIYINEQDYSTLLSAGTITKNGTTYSYDASALYVIKDVSVPEYADEAGYAVNAGTAQAAIYDSGGNNILETYATKKDTSGVKNIFYGVGNVVQPELSISSRIQVNLNFNSSSEARDFITDYINGHRVPTLIMDLRQDISIDLHQFYFVLELCVIVDENIEDQSTYKVVIDVETTQDPRYYGDAYVVVPYNKLKAGQYILTLEENIYNSKTWRLISNVNPVIDLLDLIDTFN